MKKKTILILFISTFITSCTFNSSYVDREVDRQEAERVTVKFFYLLHEKKFNETHSLFSPRFMEVTNKEKLNQLFQASEEKLGSVKDQSLESWNTNVVKGTNSKSEYLLVYNVKRTKFNSKETLRLEKENDTIKILYYNIESEGLLNQ
jgi:hypothetical protein